MPRPKISRQKSRVLLRSICSTRLAADFFPIRSTSAEPIGRQPVDVGVAGDQAIGDQPRDERLAEPFDVHGVARGEMLEAALQLRRARRVLAAPDRLVLAAHAARSRSAGSASASPSASAAIRPIGIDDAHDLRDDVAGLLDDDAVAVADVLAGHFVRVVQRGHRHGRAGDEHRLEHGERRHRARAADVDADRRMQRGLCLLGRELEGDGPPRKLRRRAQPAAQRDVVELDDDAVGVERQRAGARRSLLAPFAAVLGDLVDALSALSNAARPAGPTVASDSRSVRVRLGRAVRADELVEKRAQAALSHLLADRSGESRRTRRCAGSRTAARPRPRAPCWCARTPCAADRPRRGSRWCPSGPPFSV